MTVKRTATTPSTSAVLETTTPTTPEAPEALARAIRSGVGVALSGTAASQASLSAVLGGGSMFKNLSAASGAAAVVPTTVEPGSRGALVTELKTLLRDAGYYQGAINDSMGSMGADALRKAKLDLKLSGPVDVAGPTTFDALRRAVANRAAAPAAALSNEPNHQFTLEELTPTINAAAQKYGVDPKLLAGIIKQESTYKNYIVHDDGTGHGLIGLDDNGLKTDFEKWSGMTVGSGANAASIPPDKQIEFLAKTIGGLSKDYYQGDQFAAAREWHTGAGGVNSANGREYEQLVRGHMGASDIANMKQGTAGAATTPAPANTTPSSTATPSSTRAIVGRGDTGPAVSELQQQLVAAGASISVDGDFGPQTEAAVRAFQQKNGLPADGTVGDATRAALSGGKRPTSSTAPFDVRAGSAGQQVTELKQALKAAGFYTGVINDKMGPDGLAALARAKQALKLSGDPGVAGQTTMKALLEAAAGKTASSPSVPGEVNQANLQKLATARLDDGPDFSCVATTLANLDRLGVPNFQGGTTDDRNNARGAMVQMLKAGTWQSLALPGSQVRTIKSDYGTTQASVISADDYEQLAKAGKIPSGAVIFQTRHGWDSDQGPGGNDMGIVRDGGRVTHNYRDMPPIIYGDAKEVVILLPRG